MSLGELTILKKVGNVPHSIVDCNTKLSTSKLLIRFTMIADKKMKKCAPFWVNYLSIFIAFVTTKDFRHYVATFFTVKHIRLNCI
jgi:hypothetical protein